MSYNNNLGAEQVVKVGQSSTNYTSEKGISFYKFGTTEGVIAGVIMSALLVLLEVVYAEQEPAILAQFAVNAVLLGVIAYALNKYKNYIPNNTVFRSGILMGAYISGVAGLIIAVINIFLNLFTTELGLSLFGAASYGLGNTLLLSFGIFLVTFVNGMIITFICLQFLKEGGNDRDLRK